MSVRLLCSFMPTILWACSAPKGPNITLLVQKPTSAEYSCLGVVGFEVSSTGAGKTVQSGADSQCRCRADPEELRARPPFHDRRAQRRRAGHIDQSTGTTVQVMYESAEPEPSTT